MKKKCKRAAALLLSLALAAALCACGDAGGEVQSPAQEPSPTPAEDASPGGGTQSQTPEGFRLPQESAVRNEKFREREEFADFLARAESKFLIPGLNQAMTPQGITYSGDTGLAYITSYAITDTPSVILGVDLATGEQAAEYFLYNKDGTPFTSHVGGIAAAEGKLYVSAKLDADGSYSVAVLPMDSLPAGGSHDVTVEDTIALPVSPSFLNYSQGMLWVGNFYHPGGDYNLSKGMNFTTTSGDGAEYGCYILGFDLGGGALTVPDGEQYPVPDCVLAAPDKIQGVVCLADRVILSQSYGRTKNSALLSYSLALGEEYDGQIDVCGRQVPAYILDSSRQSESLTAMPMTEGLCLSPEGVLVLFESGSSRYSDGKYRTDRVWELKPNSK